MFGFFPSREKRQNVSLLPLAKKLKSDDKQKIPRRKVNVVILGIDTVSHMNFIRVMPRTVEFLTKELKAVGMNGYSKVGDNTFPNLSKSIIIPCNKNLLLSLV